ncbi:MAG TPA: hypothetical protein VGG34_12180 [Opitutaceae bacterium]|jgi:uncharacterized Tic20 family protein
MNLDIRYPIGYLFTVIGAILVLHGAFFLHADAFAAHSLGININLWWGIVLLAFGIVMVVLARMGGKKGGSG